MRDRGSPHSTTKIRVRYAETDMMGVVYHANYLVYLEIARVDLLRTAGIRYRDLEDAGYSLAVTEARCRYLSGARYDDDLAIDTWVVDVGAASVLFEYEIRREEDGRRIVEGSTELACLGETLRPRRMPVEVKAALEGLLGR